MQLADRRNEVKVPEGVAIIISDLTAEQTRETLSSVTSTLTALLPLDTMKLSFHDAIEKQQALCTASWI